MNASKTGKGHYLGTEQDAKWWRRHTRDKLLVRGNGEYWFDETAFCFRRFLTRDPIVIPAADIVAIRTGKWHCGKWPCGATVVKVVWNKNETRLCSGFAFYRDPQKTALMVQKLESLYLT